jgi:hypothetical protein
MVADLPIDLPPQRTEHLRTDAAFAAQMRVLSQALARGGA